MIAGTWGCLIMLGKDTTIQCASEFDNYSFRLDRSKLVGITPRFTRIRIDNWNSLKTNRRCSYHPQNHSHLAPTGDQLLSKSTITFAASIFIVLSGNESNWFWLVATENICSSFIKPSREVGISVNICLGTKIFATLQMITRGAFSE